MTSYGTHNIISPPLFDDSTILKREAHESPFQRDFDDRVKLPPSVFGRVDHVVTSGPPANIVLIAVDVIDVNWLNDRAKQDPRFDINSPIKQLGLEEPRLPNTRTPSIFESAPLFRIEVELDARTNPFELPFLPDYDGLNTNTGTQALEGAWFKFEVSATHRKGFTPALIYPSLFATPISAFVQGTMPTPVHANALAGIFSLQHFPKYQKLVFKLLSKKLAQTSSLSTMLDRETQTLYSMRIHLTCSPLINTPRC